MASKPTLKAGSLAYYQSLQGWLPCKVVSVDRYPSGVRVLVKMTSNRGPYDRTAEADTPLLHVAPRACVRNVRGSYGLRKYILPFNVEVTREC